MMGKSFVLKAILWIGAISLNCSSVLAESDVPPRTGEADLYAEQTVGLEGLRPLAGTKTSWTYVKQYAVGTSPQHPIWINGSKSEGPLSKVERGSKPPPNALLERHRWSDPLPTWNDPSVVNIRQAPYGATGDGETDNTDAIQQALNENQNVFVPKGIYRISRSLRLKSNSRFFGLGVQSKIDPMGDAFADPSNPTPLLIAPNDADATCVAAFIQLWCSTNATYAMHWQSGAGSIVRNVRTKPLRGSQAGTVNHPLVLIDGHGGGRWYNGPCTISLTKGQTNGMCWSVVRESRSPSICSIPNTVGPTLWLSWTMSAI